MSTENQEYFFYWIKEREKIREKKELGWAKPWTEDPVLQSYKFCNVRREDDRVTKWIKTNWRDPYKDNVNMYFAMCVARLFNWPDTLDAIGFPKVLNWDRHKEQWRTILKHRRDKGVKIFTGAYLVSTNGVKMDKIDYILDRVLTPIWERALSPVQLSVTMTCQEYWEYLLQFDGLGSFMAGQIVADLKYIDPILEKATDWMDWAPLGPGSIRGLNRFFGRDVKKSISQEKGLAEIRYIKQLIKERLDLDLPAHDVQNCLCETDKFIRLKKGEGKTRSTYPGV